MSNSRYKNIYLLKPYCLSILLIIACAISVGAKTTTSTSNGFTVTATDNVTLNGQTGILFKIKVIVPGPDNAGAWMILDICNMQGNLIKVNGKDLNTFGSIGLPYENNNFDNCELFISYSELSKGNISKSSPFKYFVTVQSKNKNKKNRQLKQSGYFEWNGSSSSPKPASKPASKQSSKPDNHKNQKSWVEKYGNTTPCLPTGLKTSPPKAPAYSATNRGGARFVTAQANNTGVDSNASNLAACAAAMENARNAVAAKFFPPPCSENRMDCSTTPKVV